MASHLQLGDPPSNNNEDNYSSWHQSLHGNRYPKPQVLKRECGIFRSRSTEDKKKWPFPFQRIAHFSHRCRKPNKAEIMFSRRLDHKETGIRGNHFSLSENVQHSLPPLLRSAKDVKLKKKTVDCQYVAIECTRKVSFDQNRRPLGQAVPILLGSHMNTKWRGAKPPVHIIIIASWLCQIRVGSHKALLDIEIRVLIQCPRDERRHNKQWSLIWSPLSSWLPWWMEYKLWYATASTRFSHGLVVILY